MAEHLIRAEFFGTPVSILDHAGKRWLTAEEVGRCLGYSEPTARTGITNVYNRHADEFTESDSCAIKLMAQGQHREVRIFSATGCIKLGFFAHTPTAKEFRAWAAVTLEAAAPPAPADEALPAVVRSPRLDARLDRMASSIETMAASVTTMASGMQTMQTQLNVTSKYIGLLELNQAGTRKVTAEVVREAKALHAQGMSMADIARILRVSRTAVSLVVRDKYPIAIPEAEEAAKPSAGEILEGWIEREQKRLVAHLTQEGGAA
jgi:DNA-binding CsgD family transcriptional regulator